MASTSTPTKTTATDTSLSPSTNSSSNNVSSTLNDLLYTVLNCQPDPASQEFCIAFRKYRKLLKKIITDFIRPDHVHSEVNLAAIFQLITRLVASRPFVLDTDPSVTSDADDDNIFISLLTRLGPFLFNTSVVLETQTAVIDLYVALFNLARTNNPIYFSDLYLKVVDTLKRLSLFVEKNVDKDIIDTSFCWNMGDKQAIPITNIQSIFCSTKNLCNILTQIIELMGLYVSVGSDNLYSSIGCFLKKSKLNDDSYKIILLKFMYLLLTRLGCESESSRVSIFESIFHFLSEDKLRNECIGDYSMSILSHFLSSSSCELPLSPTTTSSSSSSSSSLSSASLSPAASFAPCRSFLLSICDRLPTVLRNVFSSKNNTGLKIVLCKIAVLMVEYINVDDAYRKEIAKIFMDHMCEDTLIHMGDYFCHIHSVTLLTASPPTQNAKKRKMDVDESEPRFEQYSVLVQLHKRAKESIVAITSHMSNPGSLMAITKNIGLLGHIGSIVLKASNSNKKSERQLYDTCDSVESCDHLLYSIVDTSILVLRHWAHQKHIVQLFTSILNSLTVMMSHINDIDFELRSALLWILCLPFLERHMIPLSIETAPQFQYVSSASSAIFEMEANAPWKQRKNEDKQQPQPQPQSTNTTAMTDQQQQPSSGPSLFYLCLLEPSCALFALKGITALPGYSKIKTHVIDTLLRSEQSFVLAPNSPPSAIQHVISNSILSLHFIPILYLQETSLKKRKQILGSILPSILQMCDTPPSSSSSSASSSSSSSSSSMFSTYLVEAILEFFCILPCMLFGTLRMSNPYAITTNATTTAPTSATAPTATTSTITVDSDNQELNNTSTNTNTNTNININISNTSNNNTCAVVFCKLCDRQNVKNSVSKSKVEKANEKKYEIALRSLVKILQKSMVIFKKNRQSKNCKILTVLCLERILLHTDIQRLVQLNKTVGQGIIMLFMSMLEDGDISVRLMASHRFQVIVDQKWNEELDPDDYMSPENLFLKDKVNELIEKTGKGKNVDVRETLIIALASLAKIAEGKLLSFALISMVQFLGAESLILRSTAFDQICALSKLREMSVKSLLKPCMEGLSSIIVDCLAKDKLTNMLEVLAELLGYNKMYDLLRYTLRYTLPHIVHRGLTSTLHKIAQLLKIDDVPDLLGQNLHFILEFVFIQNNGEKKCQIENAVTFLRQEIDRRSNDLRESKLTVGDLLIYQLRGLLKLLILRKISQVRWVFEYLCNFLSKDGILSNFLWDHLLALMAFLNVQLLQPKLLTSEKRKALYGLIGLMEMITPEHLHAVRSKAMAILKLAMQYPCLVRIAVSGWCTFIRKLPVELLGPMLSHIIYALLGLFNDFPAQITDIFTYMIVENANTLKGYFKEIYMLPDHPQFQEINDCLKENKEKRSLFRELQDLIAENKGISHESLTVRIVSLRYLRDLLRDNTNEIPVLAEKCGDILRNLIKRLLDGTRESDETSRLLVVQCLGELGALDPGYITPNERSSVVGQQSASLQNSIFNEKQFAFELINDLLVPSFLAAEDTMMQDRAAYAMQELLRFCGFTSDLTIDSTEMSKEQKSKENVQKWLSFPKSVREIVHPYLQSEYRFTGQKRSRPLERPIFKHYMTFYQWISSWATEVIDMVSEGKEHSQIYDACRAMVKDDITVAIYLIPHAILNVLLHGRPEDSDHLFNEIISVLKAADETTPLTDVIHKSARAVFSIMDQLSSWLRFQSSMIPKKKQKKGAKAVPTPLKVKKENTQKVEDFLNQIPQLTAAVVAYKCNAFDRALLHLETFLRASRQNLDTPFEDICQDHIPFLQKVFASIRSADDMAGVAAIRHSSNMGAEILDHEAANRWSHALSCYSKQTREHPDYLVGHQGLLNCHLNLSHYETVISHVNDLVARKQEFLPPLNPSRVQAAWRLGDWNTLEKSLLEPCDETFEVCIGRILMAARKNSNEDFRIELDSARLKLFHHLSAIIMETGRYERAYDSIVHLHILQEIEDIVGNLLDSRFDKITDVIQNKWPKRLNLTQSTFAIRESIHSIRRVLLELTSIHINLHLNGKDPTSIFTAERSYPDIRISTIDVSSLNNDNSNNNNSSNSNSKSLSPFSEFFLNNNNNNNKNNNNDNNNDENESNNNLIGRPRRKSSQSPFSKEATVDPTTIATADKAIIDPAAVSTVTALNGPEMTEGPNSILNTLNAICKKEFGQSWIQSIRLARKAGAHEAAYRFLLHEDQIDPCDLHIERAKLAWSQGHENEALLKLQQFSRRSNLSAGSDQAPQNPNESSSQTNPKKERDSKMSLLIANWMVRTGHYQNHIIDQYKANLLISKSEKAYFKLGKYLDTMGPGQTLGIINYFSHALHYGIQYLFQTLPRLLQLWFDCAVNIEEIKLNKINELMLKTIKKLPAYVWYTAFSQILSRVCHPQTSVYQLIELIISKVMNAYPDQALWAMIHMTRSSISLRKSRCQELFDKTIQRSQSKIDDKRDPPLYVLIDQMCKFLDPMLELCNKSVPDQTNQLLVSNLRKLTRMMPLQLTVPLQDVLTASLPSNEVYFESFHKKTGRHSPFPARIPKIQNFQNKVEVLTSLQRPKKLTIIGDDGNNYVFLCKPKDDLRKDQRIMEFYSTVNTLLKKNSESRRKHLYIRTYAVIVLNEECGMLEWVHNTEGLRQILNKMYLSMDIVINGKELKKPYTRLTAAAKRDPIVMRPIFEDILLPMFPSVFYKWFLLKFPDPTSWYASRIAYSNSLSVMSIVGDIVGLGDRHGENILFDSSTGECVHVDFNCLFLKGKSFECPEKVPFRLTHNMIDALGITGYEGLFRKTCEMTLRVLRSESDSLINVLKPFVYDPVAEWMKRGDNSGGQRGNSETENLKALSIINQVDKRLNGNIKGLPLSIEGQVHRLIQEATDIDNLCVMYVGWAAYM